MTKSRQFLTLTSCFGIDGHFAFRVTSTASLDAALVLSMQIGTNIQLSRSPEGMLFVECNVNRGFGLDSARSSTLITLQASISYKHCNVISFGQFGLQLKSAPTFVFPLAAYLTTR